MAGVGEPELLTAGREAEVFLRADGRVVKVMLEAGAGGMAAVEREAAVCRMLAGTAVRTPRVVGIESVGGRAGLVMERVAGTDLLAALVERPYLVLDAARVLADAHVRMHAVVAPGELPDLHDHLAARIRAAAPLPDGLRAQALAVLGGLPRGDRLCHGDFHLGNLLGTWDDPVAIDWGHASRGVPSSDVARTDLLHRVAVLPPGTPLPFRALSRLGRRLLAARYLRRYRRRGPVLADLARWRFVHAAARLAEPIPEERPALLRLLGRSARRVGADAR
jgi:aminoglycoside phosphotransferase (APT) family kinase protein